MKTSGKDWEYQTSVTTRRAKSFFKQWAS